MKLDIRIHQTTENYEQAIVSHVLETEDTSWCQEFACRELFRERLQFGKSGRI